MSTVGKMLNEYKFFRQIIQYTIEQIFYIRLEWSASHKNSSKKGESNHFI